MATYDSTHTGAELDQAVDLLLDYRGAIDAGIAEIEAAAPELFARVDQVEADNAPRNFSSSATINNVLKEAYLVGAVPANYAPTHVRFLRAAQNADSGKWENRITLGDHTIGSGAIEAFVAYDTQAAALAGFSEPVQQMQTRDGKTLYACINPAEWAKINAQVPSTACTYKDVTKRDNAPTCVAHVGLATAEHNDQRATALEGQLGGLSIRELTEAQYDALVAAGTVDPNTVYLVE